MLWCSGIWFSKWLISIRLECLRSILILFYLSFSGMYVINRALQRLRSISSNTSSGSRNLTLNPIRCRGSLHTYFPVMQSQGQVVIASWEKAKWWCFCWLQRLLSGRGAARRSCAVAQWRRRRRLADLIMQRSPATSKRRELVFSFLRFRLPFTLNLLHHFSFSNFYIAAT